MLELNKIYNMDCIEGMKLVDGKTINCVLTSPPYNTINKSLQKRSDRGYDIYQDNISNEQYWDMILQCFNEYDRILKDDGVVLYNLSYGNQNNECMISTVYKILENTNFTLADIMVWKKPNCVPNTVSKNKLSRICEFVFVFCRRNEFMTFQANKKVVAERYKGMPCYETIFNFMEAKSTDKPTKLNRAVFSSDFVIKLLNIYTKENDVVMDNFMGTGTTAVGCVKRNRQYIGFELSKDQCEFAENRIKEVQDSGIQLTLEGC